MLFTNGMLYDMIKTRDRDKAILCKEQCLRGDEVIKEIDSEELNGTHITG